ncbi:hypothetical protein [Streptomyces sp. NPDC004675]
MLVLVHADPGTGAARSLALLAHLTAGPTPPSPAPERHGAHPH